MAGVPVMSEEAEAGCDVGREEVEREPVVVSQSARQGHQVEDGDTGRNDDALPHLEPVDASQDVDGVSAEDSQHAHVEVVEQSESDVVTQDPPEHSGHHNLRPIGGDVVHHEEGQAGHAG